MKLHINKADFVGACSECKEPTTGSYVSDDDKGKVIMECVNCHHRQAYRVPPFIEMKSLGEEGYERNS